MSGTKHDEGKLPLHLIPRVAYEALGRVLAFGVKKYDAWNWAKGMDWSRNYSAAMRHMTAWWDGEDKDPETGYSHLWHAFTDIMFLIAYEAYGIGEDDRYFLIDGPLTKVDKIPSWSIEKELEDLGKKEERTKERENGVNSNLVRGID